MMMNPDRVNGPHRGRGSRRRAAATVGPRAGLGPRVPREGLYLTLAEVAVPTWVGQKNGRMVISEEATMRP
jgi:hypothetical protein